jgi:hypothetical protein
VIRGFHGREWDGSRRCWEINERQVEAAVRVFSDLGYAVMVDGVAQTIETMARPVRPG